MNDKKEKLGFSLLEVIVAIGVTAIGLLGIISLVAQNVQAQYLNRNILIASQLAQEGLELVRNKRDINWLTPGNNWKTGAGSGTDSDIVQDNDYSIDYSGNINDIDSIDDARLYIDNNGFYTQAVTATSTYFYRLITVTGETADSVDINSRVVWSDRRGNKEYIASFVLYNWR